METDKKKIRLSGRLFLIAGLIMILSNAFSYLADKETGKSTAFFVIGIAFLAIGAGLLRKAKA